ncbi:MAG TPA: HAMP domain-containing sensor histidine kinase [Candidatus Polarisedimenticolaceae bacterium]|nr:HAMP domain-containing sensor histidine kinase [Candidatus Polarisedimenticolaceae bacterium]
MGFGAFLKRHTLVAGLLAVVLPLVVLLGVQFVWLVRLERAQAIAHEAALESFLGSVGTQIEYAYRETAERSLNLPASLFTQDHVAKAAYYWKQRPAKGAKRLFLVDFTQEEFGHFLAFDPDQASLYTPVASDESLAMILAANPLHMLNMRQHGMESAALTVYESNPDYRIVLNPILDDAGRVVGLAGMILDEDYFRTTLLPAAIDKAIAAYFPSARDELAVMVKDGKGQPVVCVGDANGRKVVAKTRLGFVFTDWEMALYSPRATPEQWARAGFLFNASLAGLLAAALLAGVGLALRAADRAVKLSAMKSDFVSNVSHELRTPVASIRVFGELLRTGRAQTAEKIREYGEYIEAESRRLSRLIDNILDFSRIESGRKEYRFEESDLRAIVDDVVRTFEVRLAPLGFTISVTVETEPLPPVRLDPDAIAQAFHNLLDNAVKYSGESKSVLVRLGREGAAVSIAVQDFGIGIAPEEQRKVFERFHRVGTGLVHDVKGSGLGLSLIRHIVQAHGGSVEVASKPGDGSVFTMRLPISGPKGRV